MQEFLAVSICESGMEGELALTAFLRFNSAHVSAADPTFADSKKVATARIESCLKLEGPGLQYVAVNGNGMVYEYAGGLADIKHHIPVYRHTTMAAFSMTKPLTAIAILQLVEAQKIRLNDKASCYIKHPYDQSITIKQLLDHTSGIPNPLPLRWVHLVKQHELFDEDIALREVLERHHTQKFLPGQKYQYSNIGYWLLGRIIESVSKNNYAEYVRRHIFQPLGIKPEELDFVIARPENHAHGYLDKYSLMNLVKPLLLDGSVWGEYEGNWLRINDVYLNGPSFGGAIGSASAFGRILQDLLNDQPVIMSDATRALLFSQSHNNANEDIEMAPGWHIGDLSGIRYFYKEGGGAGFHCEMRIYPSAGMGTVVMSNQTSFDSTKFLSKVDVEFLQHAKTFL